MISLADLVQMAAASVSGVRNSSYNVRPTFMSWCGFTRM